MARKNNKTKRQNRTFEFERGKHMSKTLDNLGVSAFCESMAMMVQSGITTDEAIRLLQSGGDADGAC